MSHPRRISPWIVVVLLLMGAVGLSSALRPAYAKDKKSRHAKLSKRQMKKMMNKWAREVGVKCEHCHVKKGETFDFDKPTENKKLGKFCDENFVAKFRNAKGKEISCEACHDGKLKFMPKPKKKKTK